MAKNNADYWKERFLALEDAQFVKGNSYIRDIQKQFRIAQGSIQSDIEKWYGRLADNNSIGIEGAKQLLNKKELEEFRWTVERYIQAGRENALDQRWMKQLENASAKVHIELLEAAKLQIQHHAEVLFSEYHSGISKFLTNSFEDAYYHSAFEVAKGTGIATHLNKLGTKRLNLILNTPWAQDGRSFSSRIWNNKEKLVHSLHTELTQNIIRGTHPNQAISNIMHSMEVSRNQAANLVLTESAAIVSNATEESFKDLDVEKYEILATLDNKTSKICRDLDGKVFDMDDYEVGVTAPPFHCRCRTTTVPFFDDEFTENEERAARDPKTGKTTSVPANMKYADWKKEYID